jgi:hypothetical protein
MEKFLGFCGLDCAGCEAFQLTQADDETGKLLLLEKWRVEYDAPEMTLASITCDGCTSSGRLGGYCQACPVRACGVAIGVTNCAFCDEFETCEILQGFIAEIPSAKANLEEVRIGL